MVPESAQVALQFKAVGSAMFMDAGEKEKEEQVGAICVPEEQTPPLQPSPVVQEFPSSQFSEE